MVVGDGSSGVDLRESGYFVVKNTKTQRRFTLVEKTFLEERLKNKQLDDRKGREDVGRKLVKTNSLNLTTKSRRV
jgi:hypothetical protein